MPNFGSLMGGISSAAKAAWASPIARSTLLGAGIGGAYGAMSDDTSVLGGAFMGATIGGLGRTALAAGKMGLRGYQTGLRRGMTRPEALSFGASRIARGSSLAANRAVNAFSSTLKGWGL